MSAPSASPRKPLPLASGEARARLRRRLLDWFAIHQRQLPWRANRDPYAIWISEVMLQQTQVATVIPYFQRFIKQFPNAAALASADEQEVLRAWEGLGYYRRARFLHLAAKKIVADHGGLFPEDPDSVRALPGFGRYTANAVLSQAFNAKLPILEANSRRVISRWAGIEGNLKTREAETELWKWAEDLLPQKRAGDFNQAVMELGALICKPEGPRCGDCPVQKECFAFLHDAQDRIPAKSPRPLVTEVHELALVIRRDAQVLLVQRPLGGRWGSMWEFPRTEVTGDVEQAAADLLGSIGVQATLGSELAVIHHGVTRFKIRLTCMEARWSKGMFQPGPYLKGRWIEPEQLSDFPLSRPQRRLASVLQNRQISHIS
ncbi:MAG: A/G-specific adenine glycosylase [Gemmataceae bacterium]|nr:A/G-specific adenine glycosylase [Gemmataceae bacterium]